MLFSPVRISDIILFLVNVFKFGFMKKCFPYQDNSDAFYSTDLKQSVFTGLQLAL